MFVMRRREIKQVIDKFHLADYRESGLCRQDPGEVFEEVWTWWITPRLNQGPSSWVHLGSGSWRTSYPRRRPA